MSSAELDFDAAYRVDGVEGIAFYLRGYATIEQEVEDDDFYYMDTVEDTSRVRAYMVGDDREHIIDIADLTKLADREYCPECGQIGCTVGWDD